MFNNVHYCCMRLNQFFFSTAIPRTIPQYKPDIQQVRRRQPLLYNYWQEEQESSPSFTFLLRPRVIQTHQTCKLLCCVSGKPPPTVKKFISHKSTKFVKDMEVIFKKINVIGKVVQRT